MTRASDTARILSGGAVINEDSNDVDFRVESNGNTHALFVDGGNEKIGMFTDSPSGKLHIKTNSSGGTAQSRSALVIEDDSGNFDSIQFLSNDTGFQSIFFGDASDNDVGRIAYSHSGNTMRFNANAGERMRVVNEGLLINCTSTLHSGVERSLEVENHGSSGFVAIFKGNTASHETVAIHNSDTSGTRILLAFKTSGSTGTLVGRITSDGSTTNYATSSDYRLKENVTYDFDATTRLKQLKPARFNWIADESNTTVDGFIAHEVSSIVPEAVNGEKDAVDADGNIDPQGIDQSKLVPLLVKTIQELEARITALENA